MTLTTSPLDQVQSNPALGYSLEICFSQSYVQGSFLPSTALDTWIGTSQSHGSISFAMIGLGVGL